MVLKLDVPFLYLKSIKGTTYDLIVFELWEGGGGVNILFMSLLCGHQKFFFNWKLIVKNKSC
jgi:hypothetical protein